VIEPHAIKCAAPACKLRERTGDVSLASRCLTPGAARGGQQRLRAVGAAAPDRGGEPAGHDGRRILAMDGQRAPGNATAATQQAAQSCGAAAIDRRGHEVERQHVRGGTVDHVLRHRAAEVQSP